VKHVSLTAINDLANALHIRPEDVIRKSVNISTESQLTIDSLNEIIDSLKKALVLASELKDKMIIDDLEEGKSQY